VNPPLKYQTLERLQVPRPVDRVQYIAALCRGKRVLDIGCLDETALEKRQTAEWLHAQIGMVAREVIGIDSSDRLGADGLVTGPNSRIVKGDGLRPDPGQIGTDTVDLIVAGEFIEHLENPLEFIRSMKHRFPGRQLVLSTPNGASFANALLASISSEAQHPDHLLTSTFKTLNTLCRRVEAKHWEIRPYRFYATEMLLGAVGAKRLMIRFVEKLIRLFERAFPLRSFGYIVEISL
jgi:SAM-dependent methyltransferase